MKPGNFVERIHVVGVEFEQVPMWFQGLDRNSDNVSCLLTKGSVNQSKSRGVERRPYC